MCATAPTIAVSQGTLLQSKEALMKFPTIIVLLFAVAALASGCGTSDLRYASDEYRTSVAHSNENSYAVIDSIESGPTGDVYLIRVRFDDRSYRTVTQSGLDGLRVGDSVRIEDDRVRRY
jgi:hypothetical protein